MHQLTAASAALCAVAAAVVAPMPRPAVAAAEPCPAVEVIFARGTTEPAGVGFTGQTFVDALEARLPGKAVDVYPVNYPASLDFPRAADGVADAAARIQALASSCPATKIVLGGFSQGAAVAAYTTADTVPTGFELPTGISGPMSADVAQHVAAVALFGKPSAQFVQMLDLDAPPITIGHLYAAKTIELCAPADPVCSPAGNDQSAHNSYTANGMTDQAADFAARAVTASA